jgi:DNA-directed RNA polymerase subunit N (RpoN/RPB10)
MMLPVRCFSCNKIISDKWVKYKSIIDSGGTPIDAFKVICITRYCCKRMFLGHVELIDKLILYSENTDTDYDENSVK